MDNIESSIRTVPLLLDCVCDKYRDIELFTLYDAKNKVIQKKITYQELPPLVKEFQALLPKDSSRIVIYLDSGPFWLKVFFAIVNDGHTAVLVDGGLEISDILLQIKQSEASLLITDSKRLTKIAETNFSDQLPPILNIDNPPLTNSKNIKTSITDVNPDSLAAIVYTSGSTGNPKGVMLSHQALCLSALAGPSLWYTPSEFRSLVILPLWHVLGLANCVLSMMVKGYSLYFIQTMKPNLLLSTLQECQINHMTVTPIFCETIYRKVLQGIDELSWYKKFSIKTLHITCQLILKFSQKIAYHIAQFLFRRIRAKISPNFNFILSGGARLNPQIIRALLGYGYMIFQGYGLSEICGAVAWTEPFTFKDDCVGDISAWSEVKILHKDKHGVGEICLKTKQLMDGYLNQAELTKSVYTDDGWFKTGDLGYVDKDHRLYVSGRLKDIIVTSAGKNIYPDDVEHYFSHMPYVEELCCYGEETDNGEEIMLVIRLTPGLTKEQIATIVDEIKLQNIGLPSYSQASKILLASKKLPRTAAKKIDRKKVKAKFSAKNKSLKN